MAPLFTSTERDPFHITAGDYQGYSRNAAPPRSRCRQTLRPAPVGPRAQEVKEACSVGSLRVVAEVMDVAVQMRLSVDGTASGGVRAYAASRR